MRALAASSAVAAAHSAATSVSTVSPALAPATATTPAPALAPAPVLVPIHAATHPAVGLANAVMLDFFLWDYAKASAAQMAAIPIHRVRSVYY